MAECDLGNTRWRNQQMDTKKTREGEKWDISGDMTWRWIRTGYKRGRPRRHPVVAGH